MWANRDEPSITQHCQNTDFFCRQWMGHVRHRLMLTFSFYTPCLGKIRKLLCLYSPTPKLPQSPQYKLAVNRTPSIVQSINNQSVLCAISNYHQEQQHLINNTLNNLQIIIIISALSSKIMFEFAAILDFAKIYNLEESEKSQIEISDPNGSFHGKKGLHAEPYIYILTHTNCAIFKSANSCHQS